MLPIALTIAGSDPSGGAGVQADLKTFHRFGAYGEAVITLLTVQNTVAVTRVEVMGPQIVAEQIEAVVRDIRPGAAKTGALGNAAVVRAVARCAAEFDFPLVVDPVMISKHGAALMAGEGIEAVRRELIPRAHLVTPNLAEAEALTGRAVRTLEEMAEAARELCRLGAGAALVKGGHLDGDPVDVLCWAGGLRRFMAERVETRHTHGTGCTYSAAITAELASGADLIAAIERAKAFVTRAIQTNPGLGSGCGPLNHWA